MFLLTIITSNLTNITSYQVQMSSEYEKPRENERVQNKQTKKKHITLDYISNFSFISYGELYQLLVLKIF